MTDEMIERARKMIGVWHPAKPCNTVANKDNIRHWCCGIGDTNPLYLDEEYAQKTRWGTIIAPPLFTASFSSGPYYPYDPKYGIPSEKWGECSNFPGIGGVHLGNDWAFYKVVKLGDRIQAKTALVEVQERPNTFAGRVVEQVHETRYYKQGELVARDIGRVLRMESVAEQQRAKYTELKKWRYTPEELKNIEDDILKEQPRGANPRYWEDVRIGDAMGHVVKGPLTMTDMACFLIGCGSTFMMTDAIAHAYLRDHPAAGIPDPKTNVPDLPECVHWDDVMARGAGVPAAFDIGVQRISWFDHLCNNWKGDDGITRALSVQILAPNLLADTTWVRGRVVAKRVEQGEHLVECDLWGEEQRRRTHSRGRAVIALPSRG